MNDYQAYEFYSEGPKGRIRKLVIFNKIPDTEPTIYNLAFGDADPITGKLDDAVISNSIKNLLPSTWTWVLKACRIFRIPLRKNLAKRRPLKTDKTMIIPYCRMLTFDL